MKQNKQYNFLKYLIIASPIPIFIFIVIIYWWWENYQGARHLNETRKMLDGEGLFIHCSDFYVDLPEPEENFAESKYISAILDYDNDGLYHKAADRDRFLSAIDLPDELIVPFWEAGRVFSIDEIHLDIGEFQGGKLEKLRSIVNSDLEVIQEIDSKVECKAAVFHPSINEQYPHDTILRFLTDFRRFSKFNSLRAHLAIYEGDRETALMCLKTNLQLVKLCDSSPFLTSLFVKLSFIRHCETIIWQGMVKGCWLESDYQLFINSLLPTDIRASEILQPINGELVSWGITVERFSKNLKGRKRTIQRTGIDADWMAFAPKGLWLHNAACSQKNMFHEIYLPIRDLNFTTYRKDFPGRSSNLRSILSDWYADTTGRTAYYVGNSLVGEKLARTACAIYLYQLRNGGLPKSLNDLVPKYIENVDDLLNPGNPLVYRVDSIEKGHWTIYSIGSNGTDDGGMVEWKNAYRRYHKTGDMVWSVPALQYSLGNQ